MANVVALGQVTGPRRLGLLPAEATGFVGREDELAGLATLLRTSRLVTVAGPAGVGKTRLTLRAAAEAAGQYRDGVWLVDLGGTDDPGQVARAVAAALGLTAGDEAGWPPVLGHLRRKELLLILDTCEHLVDACGEFADTVLRGAPGSHPHRHQPAAARRAGRARLPAAAAAPGRRGGRAVRPARGGGRPRVQRYAENRADIVRVCRRLDGIPLAIEFAAVRLRALPLPELVEPAGVRHQDADGQPPRHQPAAPDAACRDRLELPAVRPGRADAVGAAVGVRRDVRRERRRVRVRGRPAAARAGRPRACRPRRQVRGAAGPRGPVQVPAARRAARVRGGPPRGARRRDAVPRPAHRPVGGHGQGIRRAVPRRRARSATAPGGRAANGQVAADQAGALRALRRGAGEHPRGPRATRSARSSRRAPPARAAALAAPGGGSARTSPCGCAATGRSPGSSTRAGSGWAGWPRLFPESATEHAWALGARGQPGRLPGRPGPARSPTSASPSAGRGDRDAARNSPPPAATCT